MRMRKRIFAIIAVGSFLVVLEFLGFCPLSRELAQLTRGLGTTFRSFGHVVYAATSLSSLNEKRAPQSQTIPKQIWGKWIVSRVIPTTTISCWGKADAKTLLGTEIEYSPEVFRWQDVVTARPVGEVKIVSAEQFHDDNSGKGLHSSQITFRQLGIKAKEAMLISIHHPPAEITGGTIEIPGDTVPLKNKNIIVFAACNVYFEAKRVSTDSSAR